MGSSQLNKKGQNLVEFVFVLPILLIAILSIVEFAVFWRHSQAVQEIALEAAAGAAQKYVEPDSSINTTKSNAAVDKALTVFKNRLGALGMSGASFGSKQVLAGSEPLAAYKYSSTQTENVKGATMPKVELIVDYRQPYEKGVVVQVVYQYVTMFLGLELSLPGTNSTQKIVIVPKNVTISSTKISQYIHY